MNKAYLIAKLAPKLNVNQDEARVVLNSVLEVIAEALVEERNVRLVGFGTFSIQKRAARIGRNPKTGEIISIPEREIVSFKQGKDLGEHFTAKLKSRRKAEK